MRWLLFVAVFMTVAISSPSLACTCIVNADGTGDYPTIQAAISAAQDGDEICLEDGRYKGDGNRDLDYIGKAITVRSLSGSAESCVIDCEGTIVHNHRGFIFHTGEGPESILKDVTIVNGDHRYFEWSPPFWFGGAILCELASSPTITGCIFASNRAKEGGAISCRGGSSPAITACTFKKNSAGSVGGAVDSRDSSPVLTDCVLTGNSVLGGMERGGGIYCSGGVVTVDNCSFTENKTSGDGEGAGIFCFTSTVIVTGSEFSMNSSVGSSGGVGSGGAVQCREGECELTDCRFLGNEADFGGAIHCASSTLRLSESVLSGNSAYKYYGGGGAAYCEDSDVTIDRCTFARNSAETGAALYCSQTSPAITSSIISYGKGGVTIHCDDLSNPALSCCNIFGCSAGDWTGALEAQSESAGNISADPLFCNIHAEDFHLCGNSPCLLQEGQCAGRIGALGEGCGTCEAPTKEVTWGALKAGYR